MAEIISHQPDSHTARELILVVDDDRAFRVATQTLLGDEGYRVMAAPGGSEGLALMESHTFDIILSDIMMTSMGGIEFLKKVRSRSPEIPVIMVTGFGSIQTAVEAMQLGAADYLTKPCNNQELLIKIRRTLDGLRKDRELRELRDELRGIYSFGNIISRSDRMKEIIDHIRRVADTDVTILVRGESGTGKELVARALHFNSNRSEHPFVAVNCSALPENLLESELFGYEKGAFTGAMKQRIGRFEEGNGGTVFLDEIGDIPPSVQVKLLRVLQERTFSRIGGNEDITVDIRVVAATNRNLEAMIHDGSFREDLYYRLNVFPITIPPLRERLEDIPLLADHFLDRYKDLGGNSLKVIAPKTVNDMVAYSWPGNVREMQNLIKRAILKTAGDTITVLELPLSGGSIERKMETPQDPGEAAPFREYLSAIIGDAEDKYIRRLLRLHKGNVNHVARLMEIDRKTVYRKMTEYGIDPSHYRD